MSEGMETIGDMLGHQHIGSIISSDNILTRRVGWKCIVCGQEWSLRLSSLKELPVDLSSQIKSHEDRMRFPMKMAGCAFIWEEVPE